MKKLIQIIFVCILHACMALAHGTVTLDYDISGIDGDVLENVQSRLLADQKNLTEALTNEEVELLYKQAPASIQSALQPFGYFKSEITSQQLRQTSPDTWQANFTVKQGPQLKVTTFDFKLTGSGANNKAFQDYVDDLPLKAGAPFNSENYESIKTKLASIASQQGFLKAQFDKHTIFIDLENYTSSIVLHFDTGPQFYFGKAEFNENFYDPAFLQRFVQFQPGDTYSSSALMKLQQDLLSTVYFSQVSVHPQEHNIRNEEVPINIFVDPKKAQAYKFGAGYGTDTGIRGTAVWEWRQITNTGHYMKSVIQASEKQTNLESRYIIPGKNPITDQYFIGGSIENQDINDSEGETQKVSIGRVDKFNEWQRTIALSYQWDRYSIRKAPFEHTHLFLPSITFLRSYADNIIFPRNGNKISINIRGSAEPLASSSTFLQGEVNGRFITSPWISSRIILRGDFAYTATGKLDKIPLSLQYFAGGAQSIRGYSYDELGPGRYLYVASAEYQHQVKDKWWASVFVDAGNAVESLNSPKQSAVGVKSPNLSSSLVKVATGVGVIWVTPVGPLQLTFAKPLTDSHKSVKIQFTMGASL